MKINHRIIAYTNSKEYRKFYLIKDAIEKKLELITDVNINTNYRKEYQLEGVIPTFLEIHIFGDTTDENSNYIKNIVDEIQLLISSK